MPLTHHPLSPYFPLSVSLFLLRSFFHSLAFFGQRSSTSGCLRVTDAAGLRNIFASTKKRSSNASRPRQRASDMRMATERKNTFSFDVAQNARFDRDFKTRDLKRALQTRKTRDLGR